METASKARSITGRAKKASTMRPSTLSSQRPKYPMTMPTITPKSTPSSAANGATLRTSRAPAITRQDVAALFVGAERELGTRRQMRAGSVVERAVRGDAVAEEGTDRPDQHDEHADDERRPAPDQPPVLATGLLALADLHNTTQFDLRRRGRGTARDGERMARQSHVCAWCRDDFAKRPGAFFGVAHRAVSSRTRGLRNAMNTSASSVETM